MFVLINAFFLGTASGLRALAGLAIVSWAARLGYLPLEHTWLAFLGYAFTPYILSLMAIGEMVNDKLPKTPSRLIPPQFITRVVTGTLCGFALGRSTEHLLICVIAAAAGSIAARLAGRRQEQPAQGCLRATFPLPLLRMQSPLGWQSPPSLSCPDAKIRQSSRSTAQLTLHTLRRPLSRSGSHVQKENHHG